jgi:hypothetical protein
MIQNFQTPTNSLIQKWVFKIADIIETSLEHPDLGILDKKVVATDTHKNIFLIYTKAIGTGVLD